MRATTGPIGYIVKMYPRFSETFIVTEILSRERQGETLEILSLRPPVDPRFHELLAEVTAPVSYIPRPRKAEELWQELSEAVQHFPNLPGLLPTLILENHDDIAQGIEVALIAQKRKFSHLHAHFGSVATSVARIASLLTGIPYSFTAHAKDIFHESVSEPDLERKLADAHHVVTVSEFNLQYLKTKFGPAANSVRRVYNGIDLSKFQFSSPEDREPRIISVGRLVEKKGFEDLVAACRILADHGRAVDCRIIGGGPLQSELAAQIAQLGLQDQVQLIGPLPQQEIRSQIQSAAVFAAPCVVAADGNMDGLPTVLLEAMALGTPCISTNVTGITEAVRQDDTGLIVGQHSPVELASAIEVLLDHPNLRTQLALRARLLIEQEFDTRHQARQLQLLRDSREAVQL